MLFLCIVFGKLGYVRVILGDGSAAAGWILSNWKIKWFQ